MHKKYLNLCDNFWLSEYVKFLSAHSEILIFDEKNLDKIDIESHILMWGKHEFSYLDNDINNHINLFGQFYMHLNRINTKYQELIKEFIYTDLKTPKKNQKLEMIATEPSWIFLGGKEEREELENRLKQYYSQNLDNNAINELDSKEQFFINPERLLKYKETFQDIPTSDDIMDKRSKNLYLSLSQKIPYFKKDYSLIKNFNSFAFWNIQVGMFFDISGSITNTENGIIQKISFNRLTIF
jgi:hypothetical protein